MFVKPLSGKGKAAQVQSTRLSEVQSETVASTHHSRKTSNTFEEIEEDSDEDLERIIAILDKLNRYKI